jgi:hypothetical protein
MTFTQLNTYGNILVEERVERAQAAAQGQNWLSQVKTQIACQVVHLMGERAPSEAETACQMAT